MAIDTPSKRKSVINFSIPGACLLPISDGSISSVERRHLCESYQIQPVTLSRNIWIKDADSSIGWVQDKDLNNFWVQDQDCRDF